MMTATAAATELAEQKERLRELSREIAKARREGRDAASLVALHGTLSRRVKAAEKAVSAPAEAPPALRVVSSLDELERLAPAYERLLEASPAVSPFLTLEWLLPWLRTFARDKAVHFAVVEQNGNMRAVAPLVFGREMHRGVNQLVARFAGTGEGLRGNYFTCPVEPAAGPAAEELLRNHLIGLVDKGFALHLQHISPYSDGMQFLAMLTAAPLQRYQLATELDCICGALPGSFEEFVSRVPAQTRRNRLRRTDHTVGGHSPEYLQCDREEDLPFYLETLARFSIQRREREGQTSTWAVRSNMNCRLPACAGMLRKGRLRLDMLRAGGRPVAALIGFVFKGCYYCYNMGFDQEFAHDEPGHLLLGHRLRHSIEEGLSAMNFLVGDAAYKRQYFRESLPELSVTWSVPGRAQRLAHLVWDLIRHR